MGNPELAVRLVLRKNHELRLVFNVEESHAARGYGTFQHPRF